MSTSNPNVCITRVAAADLSAKQFFAVKIDNTGKAALSGAGEPAIGILQNNPASGVAAAIAISGTSKAVAGGSITAGDRLTADATGKMVTATAGRTNTSDTGVAADPLIGSNVIGIALEGAASGDIFQVAVLHMGAVPTTAA